MSTSWKGEVSTWDSICQVESSKSSDPEPDSSSVKVFGHSLPNCHIHYNEASKSIPVGIDKGTRSRSCSGPTFSISVSRFCSGPLAFLSNARPISIPSWS